MRKDTQNKSMGGSELGSMTIFIAFVILPIIFFLFTLSLDLSVYYTNETRAQKTLDEAVLYAYKFLPSEEGARKALDLYLSQNASALGDKNGEPLVSVSSDNISVTYRGMSPLTFARLFDKDSPLSLPYNVFSAARSTPLDVYLTMDTTPYLVPHVDAAPWGSISDWPAASYFQNERLFHKMVSNKQITIDPRFTTEQCFNEVFSPEKIAAIEIYDYIASFKLNSIGLGFYPGYTDVFDPARDVSKPGNEGATSNGKSISGEVDFQKVFGGLYNSDGFCAAAAEKELNHIDYQFPKYSKSILSSVKCPDGASKDITDPITGMVDDGALPCLEARQVIWSKTANYEKEQDFPSVLLLVSRWILGANGRGVERGGLLASISKIGIMLSGDLPRVGNLRYPDKTVEDKLAEKLNQIITLVQESKSNYTLYLILFSHRGVTDTNWEENITAYQNFLSTYNNLKLEKGNFSIKLFVADSPLKVVSDVISLILLQKHTMMVSDMANKA